jgi:molybdopterin synthase sulfur carrier subunit
MRIRLRLYGPVRAVVGSRESEVEIPEGTMLGQLPALLRPEYGERLFQLLGGENPFSQHMVLINGQHVGLQGLDVALADGDRVTIMPPVAGG